LLELLRARDYSAGNTYYRPLTQTEKWLSDEVFCGPRDALQKQFDASKDEWLKQLEKLGPQKESSLPPEVGVQYIDPREYDLESLSKLYGIFLPDIVALHSIADQNRRGATLSLAHRMARQQDGGRLELIWEFAGLEGFEQDTEAKLKAKLDGALSNLGTIGTRSLDDFAKIVCHRYGGTFRMLSSSQLLKVDWNGRFIVSPSTKTANDRRKSTYYHCLLPPIAGRERK